MNRSAGIFLHPTSLPSRFGVGDLGGWAYRFVDLMAENGQSMWQVCPLGPTGYGSCPYQSMSSFAGSSLMLSLDKLADWGLLTREELDAFPHYNDHNVEFEAVVAAKEKLYTLAFSRYTPDADFDAFCEKERYWLDDYALFMVIKANKNGAHWKEWDSHLKLRFPASLAELETTERKKIRYQKFLQYMFRKQWHELRAYANSRGVSIMGDIPYYASYDSADAWAWPDVFELDDTGNPVSVGGVPPDYFSETGQLWGNPVYAWENMKSNNYEWWINRIRYTLELVDWVRIDHFRGIEAYWSVPYGSETAINGEWVKGPDHEFFDVLKREMGTLPLIAEDLGIITPEVDKMRLDANIPGMKVLQFAFDRNADNPYLPYNIESKSVVYTGTHDNDTSLNWFNSLSPDEKHYICEFIGCSEHEFMASFIRMAYSCSAQLCILPMQDILWLGEGHRMNIPGKADGNWSWRFTEDMLDPHRLAMIRRFAEIYGRKPR